MEITIGIVELIRREERQQQQQHKWRIVLRRFGVHWPRFSSSADMPHKVVDKRQLIMDRLQLRDIEPTSAAVVDLDLILSLSLSSIYLPAYLPLSRPVAASDICAPSIPFASRKRRIIIIRARQTRSYKMLSCLLAFVVVVSSMGSSNENIRGRLSSGQVKQFNLGLCFSLLSFHHSSYSSSSCYAPPSSVAKRLLADWTPERAVVLGPRVYNQFPR